MTTIEESRRTEGVDEEVAMFRANRAGEYQSKTIDKYGMQRT